MRFKSLLLSLLSRAVEARGYRLSRPAGAAYTSETSKCRERLAKYCTGYGVDLGFGGDPIIESAVRVDQQAPYANTGAFPVQLGGDAANLFWFADSVLDFVYSSHLLEDFEDTERVLREWWRVLRPGGMLVIFCPDEQIYRQHCAATGQTYNTMHKHSDFSLERVKNIMLAFPDAAVVHQLSPVNIYSWELVCKKRERIES